MPELPEVETVRRGLARLVVGRQIGSVEVRADKSFRVAPDAVVERDLLDATITGARRRGKVLMLDLDTGHTLVAHLKMTGQMVVRGDEDWGAGHPTDSLIGQLPDNSTRVIIGFDDGVTLYFNDQRKFGWLYLMPTGAVDDIDLLAGMGPEPLDGDPEAEFLARVHHHDKTSIKAAILNQQVVAGIGNIYADEALWAAEVHPASPVGSLSDDDLRHILQGAIAAMNLSLSVGGSTDRTYVDAEGRRGSYLSFAKVFRRDGQPCPRCGTTIVKIRCAGRGTHLCPVCQPLAP